MESPFRFTRSAELASINASPAFRNLRKHLQSTLPNSFCQSHASINYEAKCTYIMHRDILHAVMLPFVHLFTRASALAAAVLNTHKPQDLELAFRSEGRDVFVWLQCFLSEEEDWCRTRGCPACTVSYMTSSESNIRAALSAILVSATDMDTPPSSPYLGSEGPRDPLTGSLQSLPDFSGTLPSIKRALDIDPFWGPSHYEHLITRAERLYSGIPDLISQCTDLELVLPSQWSPRSGGDREAGGRGKEMNLKMGKMARRQSRLKHEEHEMIKRMARNA